MCASCNERKGNIRDGGAGQNAAVLPLKNVRADQSLPVEIKKIGRNIGGKAHAASARKRLQQKLHLRIVAQRLKVPQTEHAVCDRLAIDNAALVKADGETAAFGDISGEDLQLDFAHQLYMDLAVPLVPHNAQHRVLFLQLPEPGKHRVHVPAVRKRQTVGQHRLQNGLRALLLCAEPEPGIGVRKTGHGDDCAGSRFIERLIFLTGVAAQLIGFFRILRFTGGIGKRRLYLQRAARDLEPGQARALCVA